MGIFSDQRDRLMRTTWEGPHGANELALEIFSIFGVGTVVIDGPLHLTANPDEPTNTTPPLTIDIPTGGSSTPIATKTNGVTTPLSTGGGGGAQPTYIVANFPPASDADKAALASFSLAGVVVSGSGSVYIMTVYPYGPGNTGYNVTVNQLQISNAETIPAGTWALVVGYPMKSGNTITTSYYMQVGVWLSDV